MTSLGKHANNPDNVRLCQGCELPVDTLLLPRGKHAYCPRCGTQLYRGGSPSLSGNLAIAVTCLLLFIPSHFFDFISIRLVGVMIPATLPAGMITLMDEGFVALSLLILFCSSLAPFIVCSSVVVAHASMKLRWFNGIRISLWLVQHLKHWVMIDVFLVSIAISCFKLQDYSDIFVGPGLIGLVLLQLFTVLLITRISVRRYWEAWQPERAFHFEHKDIHCHECHLSQPEGDKCQRCHHALYHRKPNSIQKTWAYLIAATIAIFPANLIPISILITNGRRLEDTIFSGVAGLVKNGMYGIAVIIFVASIIVPVIKILGLAYILLCIKFKRSVFHKQRMMVYFAVKWIGKWSVMDLFVISIMMTLVDRGQILDFTPGYGAVAFGIVVVLTMLAADSIDPRLIWDNAPDYKKRVHK
ncbi:PqiA/YebS family transporter subunit [Vibrio rotiferianus]|uniref:PqiA/YebS family transporter subunit n=1 Tax=Vibrio rotiferianus TaxID=190895 RepID=UPI00406A15EA